MNKFLFLTLLTVLGFGLQSCQKETSDAVTDLTEDTVDFRSTDSFCFEIVWPLTVKYKDETTVEVNSKEELHAAIHVDKKNKGFIVFPIDIMLETGEIQTLASFEDLKEVLIDCGYDFKGHHKDKKIFYKHFLHGYKGCFTYNYPLTISFDDGTSAMVADKKEAKIAVKTYKKSGGKGKPTIGLPVDITMEDGTVVTVTTIEQLKEVYINCK